DPAARRRIPERSLQPPPEPENLSRLAHGHPFRRHRPLLLPVVGCGGRTGGRPSPRGSGRARRGSARRVFGLARNHSSDSVGTGVRLPSTSVFGFNRNARSASVGICSVFVNDVARAAYMSYRRRRIAELEGTEGA